KLVHRKTAAIQPDARRPIKDGARTGKTDSDRGQTKQRAERDQSDQSKAGVESAPHAEWQEFGCSRNHRSHIRLSPYPLVASEAGRPAITKVQDRKSTRLNSSHE